MKNKRGFASDNNAGVHPDILNAIIGANKGHTIAYGDDEYTRRAVKIIKNLLGDDIDVYFVFIGTAANVLGLTAVTRSYNSIICAESSHMHQDECGAPENYSGCKLLSVPTENGKLYLDGIKHHMYGIDFEHHSQPKVLSVTQATEMGTVYSKEEMDEIAGFAHDNGMIVHMDGARIANAAITMNSGLREITRDVGVDVLSFGGTKNGMMYGEAIVFFRKDLAPDFKYIRKQGMQLASKMRFIAAQFEAYLSNDLWMKNASHANEMAQLLAAEVENIPEVKITQNVEANGVFAIIPKESIPVLQEKFFFYVWNEETSEVRWMTSYDTTPEDIARFVQLLKKTLRQKKDT
ncbi:MAG: low specificity L-threonine aldolase [Bacteroidales bacterium]|nr:MAG: low specificity L-threonine aldolase [Bacteroidales bacterium]